MNKVIQSSKRVIGKGNLIIDKFIFEKNTVQIDFRNQSNSYVFTLIFDDVSSLELRVGPYSEFFLCGFQIEDIAEYQMEGKKIRVASEDDQSYLFFYCNSLSLVESNK